MSYLDIAHLTDDGNFQARVRACTVQEGQRFRDDARPPLAALANDALRGGGGTTLTFVRLIAAFPGLIEDAPPLPPPEGAPPGPPRFDQARISDAVILAQVQTQWPTVADLHFDENGDPR